MIKVLIVDDEFRVCQLICNLIDWGSLDMQIIGVAHNGIEARELARETVPDLVITDIRMPGCTGLELVEQLREIYRSVSVIIISGYTNFEYTRLAIQYGVSDYLLKPIDKEELLATVTRIRHEIEARRREQAATDRMRRSFFNDQLKVRACYLMDVKNQKSLSMTMDQINREYRFAFKQGGFRGFLVKMDYDPENVTYETVQAVSLQVREQVLQPLRRLCMECELWFEDSVGWGCCNYVSGMGAQIKEQMTQCLQELRMNPNIYPHISFSMALSAETENPYNLGEQILSARSMIHERLIYGSKSLLTRHFPFSVLSLPDCTGSFLRKYRIALEQFSQEAVLAAVEELRKTVLEAPGITGQELYKAVSLAGDKLLENWGVAENYEQEKNEYQMLCTLSGTPEELFQRLYALALRLLDETIRRRAGDETHPFLMAKQFMEKQYMDNISLEQVASIAGFSPNYFSSQFKQETGMGFQDYLTMLRINRAKELLRSTNLSISEVCYQVGYQDIRTFNRVFKRVAALRPGEFKKLYGTSGGPVR